MRRMFALIGFTYLFTLAAAVSFGSTASLVLCNGCLLACGGLLFVRKRFDLRIPVIVLLTTAFAFGSFAIYEQQNVAPIEQLDGQKVVVTGRLCELPYEQYNKHYYILEVDSVTTDDEEAASLPVPQKIRISTQNPLRLDLYDTITGTVQLYTPSGDDWLSSKNSLASKGILLTGFLYEYESYTITKAEEKPLFYYALRMRETLLSAIEDNLPKEEASLLCAAILGDKHALDSQVYDQFVDSGISHILVVSGLHMTMIAMMVLRLLRKVHLPRRLSICCTAVVVVFFMAVTGFSASVMRSGIMLLLMLGGMFFYRKSSALNSLGFAVFLLCFWNPYSAADFSLLLSFGSTLGILVLAPKLKDTIVEKWKWLEKLRPHKICNRLVRFAIDTLTVTVSVMVTTLPLFLITGQTISLTAPLSNLLLLVPATLMIQIGFVAAILLLIPPFLFLAKPLTLAAGLLAKLLLFGTSLLSKLPFATVSSDYAFVRFWLISALVMLTYLLLCYHKLRGYIIGGLLSLLLLLSSIFTYQVFNSNTVRIAVLDVDDGISVVVSKNGQAAVIGCGDDWGDTVTDYLRSEMIQKVTYLQFVSASQQEQKNAAAIANTYEVENVLMEESLYPIGVLERSLKRVEEITYYQEWAEVTLLDDVTLQLHGDYDNQIITFTVEEINFMISNHALTQKEWKAYGIEVDIWITDQLPEVRLDPMPLTIILSVSEDDLQISYGTSQLIEDIVPVYTTGGKGAIVLDITAEHSAIIRRNC